LLSQDQCSKTKEIKRGPESGAEELVLSVGEGRKKEKVFKRKLLLEEKKQLKRQQKVNNGIQCCSGISVTLLKQEKARKLRLKSLLK